MAKTTLIPQGINNRAIKAAVWPGAPLMLIGINVRVGAAAAWTGVPSMPHQSSVGADTTMAFPE